MAVGVGIQHTQTPSALAHSGHAFVLLGKYVTDCDGSERPSDRIGAARIRSKPGALEIKLLTWDAEPGTYWVFVHFCDLHAGYSFTQMTVNRTGFGWIKTSFDLSPFPQEYVGNQHIIVHLSRGDPPGPRSYRTPVMLLSLDN
jgi:hypothetical protein